MYLNGCYSSEVIVHEKIHAYGMRLQTLSFYLCFIFQPETCCRGKSAYLSLHKQVHIYSLYIYKPQGINKWQFNEYTKLHLYIKQATIYNFGTTARFENSGLVSKQNKTKQKTCGSWTPRALSSLKKKNNTQF